uniref:mitochondrial inner membrane protease subunit 1 isoform X2 n=1 Tax=Pristiophorus japonicus TaxID=55135 RepID=UPI00398F02F4
MLSLLVTPTSRERIIFLKSGINSEYGHLCGKRFWDSFLWRTTNMLGRFFGKVLGFAGFTIQYGCIAHCTFEYLGDVVVCSGPSMEPTLKSYDVVISEKLSRQFYRIEKGDVIIAKSPNDPKINICKRVIGLEGDKVYTSSPLDVFKSHRYGLVEQLCFLRTPCRQVYLGTKRSCLVRR